MKKLLAVIALASSVGLSANGQEADQSPAATGAIQVLSLGVSSDAGGEGGPPRIMQGAVMASPGASISLGTAFGLNPNDKSQLFNLLKNKSIQRELQISDEQIRGATDIMQGAQERMQTIVQGMLANRRPDGGLNIDRDSIKLIAEENSAEAREAIEEILKPAQLRRLRQLAYQIEIDRDGLGASLVKGRLGREIGVYEGQKEQILDRAEQIEEQLKLEIAALKAEARAALLAELSPEQREAAEELLGEYFAYEEPTFAQSLRERIEKARSADEGPAEKEDETKKNTRIRNTRRRN